MNWVKNPTILYDRVNLYGLCESTPDGWNTSAPVLDKGKFILYYQFMASIRKTILATGQTYHIYNRGIERREVFTNKREYQRAVDVISYYRNAAVPIRFSRLMELPDDERLKVFDSLKRKSDYEVKIIAFCLMPNHFHLLIRQEKDGGTSRFISNYCNSYNKYFNKKYNRVGPLFQGAFKAVRIETDEQFIHLSRYIHLNPVSSFIIEEDGLDTYPWSSLPEYLGKVEQGISDSQIVLSHFKSRQDYRRFVHDQVSYAQNLERIKHLAFEE